MVQDRSGVHGKRAGQPRHFEPLAQAADLALEQGGGNRPAGHKRRAIAGNRNDQVDAPGPVRPLAAQQSAQRGDQGVVREARGVRAGCAKGRQVAADQTRIVVGQTVVAQPRFVLAAGLKIGQDNIRPGHQPSNQAQPLGRGRIGYDALLAAVPHMKTRHTARRIALGRLDLDHLRALLGEQHPGIRTSNALCQINDPDAIQRASHGVLLECGSS